MDNEEDEYCLNLDSPKRHSDPAPCTSSNGSRPESASAFAFSVPDLRDYSQGSMPGSPARSPLLDGASQSGTPSPARHSLGAVRRQQNKHRRHSQGYPSPPPSSVRRANASPARLRRNSLWAGEDPWAQYRARSGTPIPNGDDKPFMAEEGCYRLRSFSVTSKGIVNLGDMVRTRSPSLTSEDSAEHDFRDRLPSVESVVTPPTKYKVLLLGAEEVGKSSLMAQFTTSECLTTVATDMQESLDGSQERTVSLLVDGEETELSCEDPNDSSYEVDDPTFASTDAFLLVYSVTERKSLHAALQELGKLRKKESKCQGIYPNLAPKVYILVANKVDLVRARIISIGEGKALADRNEVKYIETSVGFNHNVDELLVGVVTQIRLKKEQFKNSQTTVKNFIARSLKLTDRAKGFMDRLLQKCDLKTKSCDNLNVL